MKIDHTDADKLYMDAGQPAVLIYSDHSVDCPTLQEAVLEWHRLPPDVRKHATIKVSGGTVYNAEQIDRLHYGPRPSN
jgi:hypothetical protein